MCVFFLCFRLPRTKEIKRRAPLVKCRQRHCEIQYPKGEDDEHWLQFHENKHIALICECGYASISVCGFSIHLKKAHKIELQYNEIIVGFLWRVPAFVQLQRCTKDIKTKSGRKLHCYFQSNYKQVLEKHDCNEEMKGYPIEIMDEPLFFDAIKHIIKPERGFPLERNRNFKPPGNAKFVHEHPYNAEDESNFKHVRKLILSQNKENN